MSRDFATAERIARRFAEIRYGIEYGLAIRSAEVPPRALQEALDWMAAVRAAGLEIVEAEEGR